jgi:hypothetical protein
MKEVPEITKLYAKQWVRKFVVNNPSWGDGWVCEDEWQACGEFDLNLYCDDGYITVNAYPMTQDANGDWVTDYDTYMLLVSLSSD